MLKKRSFGIVLLLICFYPFVWPSGDGAKGPLYTKNLYALYIPFINLSAESAEGLKAGEVDINVQQNCANTFRLDYGSATDDFMVILDYENYHFNIDFNYGVTSSWDLGIEGSFVSLFEGVLDPYITGFHQLFGFPGSGRERFPENSFQLAVGSSDFLWINIQEPSRGINSLLLKSRINLLKPSKQGLLLSIQPAVKIPLSGRDVFLSNNKVDAAVSLMADIIGSSFRLYLNGGWVYVGRPDSIPEHLFTCHLVRYVIDAEWILTKALSLNAQVNGISSPYLKEHRFISSHSLMLNLGGKVLLPGNVYVQLCFSEELFFYGSTDIQFTLSAGFRR